MIHCRAGFPIKIRASQFWERYSERLRCIGKPSEDIVTAGKMDNRSRPTLSVIWLFFGDSVNGIKKAGRLFVSILVHSFFAKTKVAEMSQSEAPLIFPQSTLDEKQTYQTSVR